MKLVPCRNLYQKLAPMYVTKIVRLDWSAVFESLDKNFTAIRFEIVGP